MLNDMVLYGKACARQLPHMYVPTPAEERGAAHIWGAFTQEWKNAFLEFGSLKIVEAREMEFCLARTCEEAAFLFTDAFRPWLHDLCVALKYIAAHEVQELGRINETLAIDP